MEAFVIPTMGIFEVTALQDGHWTAAATRPAPLVPFLAELVLAFEPLFGKNCLGHKAVDTWAISPQLHALLAGYWP